MTPLGTDVLLDFHMMFGTFGIYPSLWAHRHKLEQNHKRVESFSGHIDVYCSIISPKLTKPHCTMNKYYLVSVYSTHWIMSFDVSVSCLVWITGKRHFFLTCWYSSCRFCTETHTDTAIPQDVERKCQDYTAEPRVGYNWSVNPFNWANGNGSFCAIKMLIQR